MRIILVPGFIAFVLLSSSCGSVGVGRSTPSQLTEDEKHRLYSAALAASDAPLDSDLFKNVCRKIDVFDAAGKPNDKYMAFVARHVDWGTKSENGQFRSEIDTKEKAREYINQHLRQ